VTFTNTVDPAGIQSLSEKEPRSKIKRHEASWKALRKMIAGAEDWLLFLLPPLVHSKKTY